MHGGLVLDCCFYVDSSSFSAATVRRLLFGSNRDDILGKHNAPVCFVEYSYAAGWKHYQVSKTCVFCLIVTNYEDQDSV
ncbi:hypothetical protein PIB30_080154 [Stylosanthes scabra]|uniref:Uncharacterized protein n=1 Tax=Stylosanthes scabra TaxID=79078 RepID=A0ABU6YQS4_9FABA|nr:hypothetical protein [Stylosanthes scabra]